MKLKLIIQGYGLEVNSSLIYPTLTLAERAKFSHPTGEKELYLTLIQDAGRERKLSFHFARLAN